MTGIETITTFMKPMKHQNFKIKEVDLCPSYSSFTFGQPKNNFINRYKKMISCILEDVKKRYLDTNILQQLSGLGIKFVNTVAGNYTPVLAEIIHPNSHFK